MLSRLVKIQVQLDPVEAKDLLDQGVEGSQGGGGVEQGTLLACAAVGGRLKGATEEKVAPGEGGKRL